MTLRTAIQRALLESCPGLGVLVESAHCAAKDMIIFAPAGEPHPTVRSIIKLANPNAN